jgi:hypothetical protein
MIQENSNKNKVTGIRFDHAPHFGDRNVRNCPPKAGIFRYRAGSCRRLRGLICLRSRMEKGKALGCWVQIPRFGVVEEFWSGYDRNELV